MQVKILIAIVIAGVAFWTHNYIGTKAVDEYKAEQAIVQAAADKAQQDKYNKLSEDYEQAKANKEIVYKTLTRTVERIVKEPAYQVPCISQEGVEVANKALEGVQ